MEGFFCGAGDGRRNGLAEGAGEAGDLTEGSEGSEGGWRRGGIRGFVQPSLRDLMIVWVENPALKRRVIFRMSLRDRMMSVATMEAAAATAFTRTFI